MSDELNALQDTATQARAKANELTTALTDASSDEERAAATDAEQAAVTAESAFADAKAKADADAAAAQDGGAAVQEGNVTVPVIGDACVCNDGRKGTYQKLDGSDTLYCTPFAGNDQ